MTIDDEVTRYHRERDIPVPLQKKLELLHHFTQYMDEFLTEGKSSFHLLFSLTKLMKFLNFDYNDTIEI